MAAYARDGRKRLVDGTMLIALASTVLAIGTGLLVWGILRYQNEHQQAESEREMRAWAVRLVREKVEPREVDQTTAKQLDRIATGLRDLGKALDDIKPAQKTDLDTAHAAATKALNDVRTIVG